MLAWKSKGLSGESIKPPATSNNSLYSFLNHIYNKIIVKRDWSSLKQDKVAFTYKKVVNIYIIYEMNLWSYTQDADFALENYLLGAVKSSKNTTDFDKYKNSGYGIEFDAHGSFSLSSYQMLVSQKESNDIWCRYKFICVWW